MVRTAYSVALTWVLLKLYLKTILATEIARKDSNKRLGLYSN